MNFSRSKSTKRFKFNVSRNTVSHKAGANTFTITGRDHTPSKNGYQVETGTFASGQSLTMTVKEAQALQKFLSENLYSK